MELVAGLVLLGLALGLITVIGHGLGVLAATILRILTRSTEQSAPLPLGRRPRSVGFGERYVSWLPELSSASLLALARLLRMAALSSRALNVYEVLVKTYAASPGVALEGAWEAGRFAHREQKPEKARWFLQQALAAPLPPAEYEE